MQEKEECTNSLSKQHHPSFLKHFDDLDTHGASSSHDRFTDGFEGEVLSEGVSLLDLGDLEDMFHGNLTDKLVARLATGELETCGFLEEVRDGGGLDSELEAVVFVGGDDDGHGDIRFDVLCAGIEVLAEGHDVEAVLPQGGAHRGHSFGLARHDCEADESRDLPLSHGQRQRDTDTDTKRQTQKKKKKKKQGILLGQ